MSLIHELSSQTPLPGFDVFSVPPTQTTVERDIVTEHRPLSTLQADQLIEFLIPSAMNDYIAPREALLFVRLHFELATKDKTAVNEATWRKVTPVNNLFQSLFESVNVFVGKNQINSSNNPYPYNAYFDTLFNLHDDALKSYMTASLYNTDETKRREYIKTTKNTSADHYIGASIDLCGKLHLDIFNQPKSIIGGTTLGLQLTPNKPSFYLNITDSNITAKAVFEECFLEVHRSRVFDPIAIAHNEALKLAPTRYPICRRETKPFTATKGSLDVFIDNAITGQLPNRLYIAALKNSAFHGSYDTDPFKFEHFNINYIVCFYNSTQIPTKAYKPDFDKNRYIREYIGLYETANQLYGRAKLGITREEYKSGQTIFGFQFSPDLSDDCNSTGYTQLVQNGNLRVEIHFQKALEETITILLYAEYDNILQIDQGRDGFIDHH